MSAVKVAVANIHVQTDTGEVVIVKTGHRIPKELLKFIGNTDAYTEVDDSADDERQALIEAGRAQAQADAAKAQADADAAAAQAKADADAAAKVAGQGADDQGGANQGGDDGQKPAYDPTTEPESDKKYVERGFQSLRAAAKARDLSGEGNTETLIARLEADDRDRAANTAQ